MRTRGGAPRQHFHWRSRVTTRWCTRPQSPRAQEDRRVAVLVRVAHEEATPTVIVEIVGQRFSTKEATWASSTFPYARDISHTIFLEDPSQIGAARKSSEMCLGMCLGKSCEMCLGSKNGRCYHCLNRYRMGTPYEPRRSASMKQNRLLIGITLASVV